MVYQKWYTKLKKWYTKFGILFQKMVYQVWYTIFWVELRAERLHAMYFTSRYILVFDNRQPGPRVSRDHDHAWSNKLHLRLYYLRAR